ncbi:MAG: hypothetical protein L0229_22485 [Blastocatellia bacterium]|nr:hypothetical protein [Blastocatellia bacterium]
MSKQNGQSKPEPPACRPECQVNHTLEHTAALLDCSTRHVRNLIKAGALQAKEIGLGERRHLRVPHRAIREFQGIRQA